LARIPELYTALQSAVRTNVSLEDVLALAPFATHLEPAHLRSRFIGKDQVRQYRVPLTGASVLLPNAAAIRSLLEEAVGPIEEDSPLPVMSRVEVVRGGHSELAVLAQERLLYAGLEAVLVDGDLPVEGSTRLLASPAASPEARTLILATLGLSEEAVVPWADADPAAPFRLEVGDDYDPCSGLSAR
jgi:hypothetical protein